MSIFSSKKIQALNFLVFILGVFNFGYSQNISSDLQFSITGGSKFPVDANNCAKAAPTASFIVIKLSNNSSTTDINAGEVTMDSIPTGWTVLGPVGRWVVGDESKEH